MESKHFFCWHPFKDTIRCVGVKLISFAHFSFFRNFPLNAEICFVFYANAESFKKHIQTFKAKNKWIILKISSEK